MERPGTAPAGRKPQARSKVRGGKARGGVEKRKVGRSCRCLCSLPEKAPSPLRVPFSLCLLSLQEKPMLLPVR